MHKLHGFTLIEVLVAITILGILASVAAPSFTNTLHRVKIKSISTTLTSSFQLARTESIRRGFQVIVVRRTDNCSASTLDPDAWSCGWRLVVDTNNNGTAQTTEPIIQEITVPTGYNIMHPLSGSRVIATRWGQLQGVGQGFVISPVAGGVRSASTTTVCVNSGGRIRTLSGEVSCN